jgi:hypothetical protein
MVHFVLSSCILSRKVGWSDDYIKCGTVTFSLLMIVLQILYNGLTILPSYDILFPVPIFIENLAKLLETEQSWYFKLRHLSMSHLHLSIMSETIPKLNMMKYAYKCLKVTLLHKYMSTLFEILLKAQSDVQCITFQLVCICTKFTNGTQSTLYMEQNC